MRKLLDAEKVSNDDHPMNDLQRGIVGMVHAIHTGREGGPPNVHTVGDAVGWLREKGPV